MSKKERVLLIDDDQEEAQNHIDLMMINSNAETIEFILKSPEYFGEISDYLAFVKQMGASAIIIDQRLGEKSSAEYSGLELADKLRVFLPILPIFILTKYAAPDSLEARGESLDDIMDKRDFHKNSSIYVTRLLRAMGRYKEASSSSRKRLDDLIQLGFERELNFSEKTELNGLRSELMWLNIHHNSKISDVLQNEIDLRKELLEKLKNLND